jgi:hypothetical protein
MNTIRVSLEPATILILAIVAAPFVLLFFPKTRRLGAVLLGIEGLIVVVAGVFWWLASLTPVPTARNWPTDHRIDRRVLPSPPAPLPQAGEGSSSPRAEIEPDALPAKKPSAPAAEAENTLPGWVGRPPQATGDVYRMSITIGPYTTRAECDARLPEEVQKALNEYVRICLGERMPSGVVLPEAEFRQAIVKDQQEEVRRYSVGPMVNLHVLLEFDRVVKQRILEQLRQAAVGRRIWVVGAGMAALLAVLGVFYGYLKLGANSFHALPIR